MQRKVVQLVRNLQIKAKLADRLIFIFTLLRCGRGHTVATHTFNLQVEQAIPAFTPQLQSITALWLVVIFHPTACRRLLSYQELYPQMVFFSVLT